MIVGQTMNIFQKVQGKRKFINSQFRIPSITVLLSNNKYVIWRAITQGIYKRMVQFQKLTINLFLNLTRAQRTPSAATTVQVSYALLAILFSCLLRGLRGSFQDGVAAGKGFLCAPF
jgi:hypothetical protein